MHLQSLFNNCIIISTDAFLFVCVREFELIPVVTYFQPEELPLGYSVRCSQKNQFFFVLDSLYFPFIFER